MLKRATVRGLRAIAIFEAAKGFLVLAAGFSLFAFVHADIQLLAEQAVRQLHFNPASHFPQIFNLLASKLTDAHLRVLALLAVLYSAMRFVEAYGLWFARSWAEWFALISCGIYIPVELFELAKGFTWLKLGFVGVNLAIIGYLLTVMRRSRRMHELVGEGGAG